MHKPHRERVHVVHPGSPQALKRRVYRLRYRVYVDEMGLSVGGNSLEGLRDDADDTATSFLCEVDGEDVGTLRLVGIREQPLELFEQSDSWTETIERESYDASSFCEVNRFMIVRSARRTNAAMKLVSRAFKHATRVGYCEAFIAAKKGRLFHYYKKFYRGIQLSDETTPYRLGGRVLGHYHLMRFDLGRRWSLRRLKISAYYKMLAFCATHMRPLVRLAVGRRSGFKGAPVPRPISHTPSQPLLRG